MGLLNSLVLGSTKVMPKFIIGRIAAVYVAGDKLEDGLNLVEKLNSKGFSGTLDLLGEEVTNRRQTNRIRDSYCELLDGIANAGIDCNVSLKLTALGLKINEDLCWDNLSVVLDKAREYENFVRMDMEDASVTELTLRMCDRAKKYYSKCGTVLQAYMHRTIDDIDILDVPHSNIRICKGAYKESENIAYQDYQKIRDNYLECAEKIMDKGIYVGLATHDDWLIESLLDLIKRKKYKPNKYEFQALSGVPIDKRLDSLISEGHKVRYYVPYGPEWYAYSIRRMRENPDIWKDTMKAFFFRTKHRR
jgi:proline dehydrogenase